MRLVGNIYALDLATRTGWAIGPAGLPPASGSVLLKKPSEDRAMAFSNFIAFLNDQFKRHAPALVVKERMFSLQASAENFNSEANVRMHAGLHAIAEGMCGRFGIDWEDVADSTVRKHFTGKGRWGSREETKRQVIIRCHQLSLMPRDCVDDNRADAIAVHDWACATRAGNAAFGLVAEAEKVKRHG